MENFENICINRLNKINNKKTKPYIVLPIVMKNTKAHGTI